jgi:hypothetical protein
VGVVAFRWRGENDAEQFSLAVPAYMIAGLLAEPVDPNSWKLADGYASLANATRGSALAFAPTEQLAQALARRAADRATRGA